MNWSCSFGGGGGGCVWSWFTWLESGSLSSFPTSLRLFVSPKAWSRAWRSYNLNQDFLLLGCWVGDSNSSSSPHFLGGAKGCSTCSENCCSKQTLSTWQESQASICENLAVSGRLRQTQLPPLPAPDRWPGNGLPAHRWWSGAFGHHFGGKLWSASSSTVRQVHLASCSHPCNRSLKAGDKVSYIGLTTERALWTPDLQLFKCWALLEVPVAFPLLHWASQRERMDFLWVT